MSKKIKITVPILKGTISQDLAQALYNRGYRKVRAVIVFPNMQDREVICQGVACPTMYTNNHRGIGSDANKNTRDLYAQSSWFFRTVQTEADQPDGTYTPSIGDNHRFIPYVDREGSPMWIKKVEIQGHYEEGNKFKVDKNLLTYHSPDIEFDDVLSVTDYTGLKYKPVGTAQFTKTLSSIDIQTETPGIDTSTSAGFTKMAFTGEHANGIISGLFWQDYVVDDNDEHSPKYEKYNDWKKPARWITYPWQKNGSLNNDIERPADQGVRSAVLKKKIISNLRFSEGTSFNGGGLSAFTIKPQLFSSDDDTILKLDTKRESGIANVYQGNVDDLLIPDKSSGVYFSKIASSFNPWVGEKDTPFTNNYDWIKTYVYESEDGTKYENAGLHRWCESDHGWNYIDYKVCNEHYWDLVLKKENVRMKYKSTKHLVFGVETEDSLPWNNASLPVIELRRDWSETDRKAKMFGGDSDDALKENIWIPCGKPQPLSNVTSSGRQFGTNFYYEYGDTYYQRWDCLKTYAFTPEDINQVVEIGSFMMESRVNLDGRYDRNRGQINNLYMSPRNFNLLNPVYTQKDNFFSYRIQDEDSYKDKTFPNQITWSKTKTSGADVDLWTNVTLASILEMDGHLGQVRKLIKFNDQMLCFQDKGISQILYNENVQIASTEGVPIEIANSGKVQGKRYYNSVIGCSNKWSIVPTPSGIYFMDSINKHIFVFDGQLKSLSGSLGFNTWSKQNIPSDEIMWTPSYTKEETVGEQKKTVWGGFDNFIGQYDKLNQDVLFTNHDISLAYSEKLNAFTSFYDYGYTPFLCSLQDTGVWVRNEIKKVTPSQGVIIDIPIASLYMHQAGDYCSFFGEQKPFWMTLVGNPEPQMDKIFTNLEFRACVDGDGTTKTVDNETVMDKFYLPFDSLETWNEYQHGYTALDNKSGHALFVHGGDSSALIRKFRMWRNDIPRNNCQLGTPPEGTEWPYSTDAELGISRHVRKPMDRMRNPWLYLKLMKKANGSNLRTEIHDVVMTYFD